MDVPDTNETVRTDDAELEAWRRQLECDFAQWLDALTEMPLTAACADDEPDLYSFYEELTALRNELRAGNRKSAETLNQFGDALSAFTGVLDGIKEDLAAFESEKEAQGRRQVFRSVVELRDRMGRLDAALGSPPRKRLIGGHAQWQEAWESLRRALGILTAHTDALLKKEGIVRVGTQGRAFDPVTMVAVESEETDAHPAGTVIEEFTSGYIQSGVVLQFAEVKVARAKEDE